LKAENDARTPVIAALAVLGAAAVTAGVSWRATRSTLQGQEIDRGRQEIDRQGQITDRFSKAIDQLGSAALDVRLGGLYALERVASDSDRDHTAVMEVLSTFVREHSGEQWPPPTAGQPDVGSASRITRPDVQAALTVIGRRNTEQDRQPINLAGAILPRADIKRAILAEADLTEADLTGANLYGAILTEAGLFKAILADADLTNADLTNASVLLADLTL
jgi:hypothetical protein